MRKIISNMHEHWSDLLKDDGDRYRKKLGDEEYTFVEGYGAINNAEIANWFKTIDSLFEQILDRVAIQDSTAERADKPGFIRIDRRSNYNRKRIKELGVDISSNMLNAATKGYFTVNLNEDTEQNIIDVVSRPEYDKIIKLVYDTLEQIFSRIFDEAYHTIRYTMDNQNEEAVEDVMDISPDEPLSSNVIEHIWTLMQDEIRTHIREALVNLESSLMDAGLPKEIMQIMMNDLTGETETSNLIKEFTAYIFQSFAIKYPMKQWEMSPAEDRQYPEGAAPGTFVDGKFVPDIGEAEGDWQQRPEIKFGEDDEEERRRFENKYKSVEQDTTQLNWTDVLRKKTGATVTTSAGFAPALHNKTYSKTCCEECEEKKRGCGCGN